MSVKVSVVLVSYNQGDFIEATINSLLKQTYSNLELLLIDGGSTDSTMEIVRKYEDRFSIIIHEKDKGQTDAINKGFKLATGELVGWINSDDILYPDCIEQIAKIYDENKDGVIYYSRTTDVIDLLGEKYATCVNDIPNKDHLLKKGYAVNQQGSFYSAEALKKVQYLDESLHYCMDLDLWLKLMSLGGIYQEKEKTLAAYRIGGYDTKTSTGGHQFLIEIRKTLLKYGASHFSPTVRKTYWEQFKICIKKILRR